MYMLDRLPLCSSLICMRLVRPDCPCDRVQTLGDLAKMDMSPGSRDLELLRPLGRMQEDALRKVVEEVGLFHP